MKKDLGAKSGAQMSKKESGFGAKLGKGKKDKMKMDSPACKK